MLSRDGAERYIKLNEIDKVKMIMGDWKTYRIYTRFYKNNFLRTRALILAKKIKNKLRTKPEFIKIMKILRTAILGSNFKTKIYYKNYKISYKKRLYCMFVYLKCTDEKCKNVQKIINWLILLSYPEIR